MNKNSFCVHGRFMEEAYAASMKILSWFGLALGLAGGVGAAPWQVDSSRSSVQVVVKATVDSFVAEVPVYEVDVDLTPGRWESTRAAFRCTFNAVQTGKKGRDEEMLHWYGDATDGKVEFQMQEVVPGKPGEWEARGTLLLHGVRRSISFPVVFGDDGSTQVIDGEVPLDTRDFGLEVIKKVWVLKVDPVVRVRFHLQGKVRA